MKTRVTVHGLSKELKTNRLGVASFQLTPSEDEVRLTIKATDDEGQIGRRNVQLQVGGIANDFLIRPDKSVYNSGETMSLVALGGGGEPVFVDLLKDDQTMLTRSIPVQAGKGRLDFDLPPDLYGTIKLCAYRFGPAGLAVRKTRMVFVRQAKEINIQATLDRDEYRPGGKARLTCALAQFPLTNLLAAANVQP